MRKTNYILTMLLLLCAATSCSEALENGTIADEGTIEPLFAVSRGFNPPGGSPAWGDTYTLISYGLNAKTITSEQQRGYYGYDVTGGFSENLVPIRVSPTAPYEPIDGIPLVKDRASAQMLNSVPVSGAGSNNQGIYRTAVIHPAIPVQNATSNGLGYLPVFNIEDDVWASSPDDADGDPLTIDDPFEITVLANGQVHNVPADIRLYPVRAGLKVYFYSHYFSDTDPVTPLKQTFSVQSMYLVNAGSNGWFNARTGVVYPNYNYNPDSKATIHSLEVSDPYGHNYQDLLPVDNDNSPIPGTPGATAQCIRDDIRVFPSDYSGNDPAVLPMSLAIVLEMTGGGMNRVNIPVSFKIGRGKEYTFYVNVTSELVNIQCSVADWDPVTEDYKDIGGPVMDYIEIPLTKVTGNWDPVTGNYEDIGN